MEFLNLPFTLSSTARSGANSMIECILLQKALAKCNFTVSKSIRSVFHPQLPESRAHVIAFDSFLNDLAPPIQPRNVHLHVSTSMQSAYSETSWTVDPVYPQMELGSRTVLPQFEIESPGRNWALLPAQFSMIL